VLPYNVCTSNKFLKANGNSQVALRHILDACKRDKKEMILLPRHVKRGFVVLQRMLTTCRQHIAGDKVCGSLVFSSPSLRLFVNLVVLSLILAYAGHLSG